MDSDFEELESLFSCHFGRTPCNSQDDEGTTDESELDNDGDNEELDSQTVVENRVCDFLDANSQGFPEYEPDITNSSSSGEEVCDDEDVVKITQFVKEGCGCKRVCSKKLNVQKTLHHVLSVREMTKEESEMYIMGSLNSCDDEKTQRGKKRKRARTHYRFNGENICKKTFMLVYDIGRNALEALVAHVKKQGATPRRHGNAGRRPKHALLFEDIKRVVEFIQNFSEAYGLPQPAAPRGRDNLPPIYLESGLTKLKLHKDYVKSCEESTVRAVKQSGFCEIWNNCLPHVKIASPRDDVCATCEKHRQAIQSAVDENEKLETMEHFRGHVLMAQKEREVYNECIKKAKDTRDLGSHERYNHYTFDFSQNVSIPHFSRQMGPIYFASLRKVHIFGVRIDGHPKQVNFLIDESETIGKDGTQTHGPNAVISMLDHVLNTYGQGETSISLHADNCPGQNKNRFMIGYLQWRVMTGRQDAIEYLMQVPGHARCLVDGGFGHLKKLYRRSNTETLDQLEDVVGRSSSTNEAIRYPQWQWRDWKRYLGPLFHPIPGIRKYQYFRMTKDEPGIVTIRTGADEAEQKINIAVRGVDITNELPPILEAAGLSHARSQYLYRVVRPYLSHASRDITCPAPAPVE